MLAQLVDPNNLPTASPSVGRCFAVSDPASGSHYAEFSKAQMVGRTFMYWFNDMSGAVDDGDYNALTSDICCLPGTASPDGGTVTNSNLPTGNITVALVQ